IELPGPDEIKSRLELNQTKDVVLGTTVTQKIYKELEEIGTDEGRNVNELVREAIATWVRNR
ncbi:unnamed protein product, partial [marine sediment metagenome]